MNANHFSDGLASIKIGKKWGFIDKTGKVVIQPQFDDAKYKYYYFSEGLAKTYKPNGDLGGYIDKQGNFVWKK
ncbi:MAG: WG repeat-containing protein [Deltaproteobacteria bacterium]|nr:WG repeat-containing protein [Deltaproteobacteria bacterium]